MALTTETIKTSLSSEVWHRQQLWSHRLECYVNYLSALEQYGESCCQVAATDRRMIEAIDRNLSIEQTNQRNAEYNSALDVFTSARQILTRSLFKAGIVASGEPLRLIHILKPEPDLKGHEQFDAEGGRIGAFMAHFMKAARIDMQYQTNFIAQSDDPAELTPSV